MSSPLTVMSCVLRSHYPPKPKGGRSFLVAAMTTKIDLPPAWLLLPAEQVSSLVEVDLVEVEVQDGEASADGKRND